MEVPIRYQQDKKSKLVSLGSLMANEYSSTSTVGMYYLLKELVHRNSEKRLVVIAHGFAMEKKLIIERKGNIKVQLFPPAGTMLGAEAAAKLLHDKCTDPMEMELVKCLPTYDVETNFDGFESEDKSDQCLVYCWDKRKESCRESFKEKKRMLS